MDNLDLSPVSDFLDTDSGMSSGDNSLRYVYNNVNDSPIDKEIKCLNTKARNEIPSCSYDIYQPSTSAVREESLIDTDFIVINLYESTSDTKVVGTSAYDCDTTSVLSVGTSQSLVPVANNELVKSESQKLVSLSLSILLAALLQAMRCFAQFLEDIVAPQRL